jgi:hypothetical protein
LLEPVDRRVGAGNITSAFAILTGARFQQVTPPTAVLD